MRRVLGLAVLIGLGSLGASTQAADPPSGSPLARGEHPRLFFSAAELPALRDRIAQHYRTEFQSFVNLLNNTSALTTGQKAIENDWGSMNHAFVAVLDPAQMQQRGFTFSAALDSPEEYCGRAMTYARTKLSAISAGTEMSHSDLNTGYPQAIYFPVMAAYDWCYPHIGSADRQAIVDAFVAAYQKNYQGRDLIRGDVHAEDMMANNQASADIQDGYGIVAFYNDPYPAASLQAEMYQAFQDFWLNRILGELNYFYTPATGWHEGSGGYLTDGFLNLGLPVSMFSSALGVHYGAQTPFFAGFPRFAIGNVLPHSQLSRCGTSGTARCPEYLQRWGTISGGISGAGCKTATLAAGLLRRAAHPDAGLAAWVCQSLLGGCEDALQVYGGDWSNAVLYSFLFGIRGITPTAPTAANAGVTQRLGLGEYTMRSGYGATDSQVTFWARAHELYGHDSTEFGHFTLHKFGNLILTPANSKSGDAVLSSAKFNLFNNVIGIHKGTSDQSLGFNGAVVDPFFGGRGISRIEQAGRLVAEAVGNGSYDYVGYDNAVAWSPGTVTASQREFVFLRGAQEHEYIVVFDRVNVVDPAADDKIWKIWVPVQPVFVNGSSSNPRAGKWTSSSSNTVSVTNSESGLKTPRFESAPTNGKFFMKTLLPDSLVTNFLGGPGKEYQSGNDDGATPWGSPTMTQGMREYLGWGRIEIRPAVARAYDTFLNVIQFGSATGLASMASVVRVQTTDAAMVGAHVQDAQNERVVLFAANPSQVFNVQSAVYTYSASATQSRHLAVNLARSTNFHVSANGGSGGMTVTISTTPRAGAVQMTSTSGGVIAFMLNGSTVSPDQPPQPPPPGPGAAPAAPTNVRIIR